MLTEDMLQPLLQQMFKKASHSTDTSPEMSAPFVSRLINNCLLYARPDHTQTLLQFVLQVSKVIQCGLCLSFCCKFFHGSVSWKSSNSYRVLKNKMWFSLHKPISVIALSDVDGCNGNKERWYPVLSRFITYIPEDLCRFAVPKIINID